MTRNAEIGIYVHGRIVESKTVSKKKKKKKKRKGCKRYKHKLEIWKERKQPQNSSDKWVFLRGERIIFDFFFGERKWRDNKIWSSRYSSNFTDP